MSERKLSADEQALIEKAHRFLPGGSLGNVSADLVIKEGHGSRVWDVSGNEYVDYLLGSGPMLVGHAHPDVVGKVQEQIGRGSTFFASNESAIMLAEEIVKAVPCAEMVRFSSSGTEATLYAMRVARAFRKKDKILKFEGGFHGMNDHALMSMGPADQVEYPLAISDSAGIPASVSKEMLIAPFNDIEITSTIIDDHHNDLGGVIVEPFQRLIPPKPGFLEGLREITSRYQIPLIFDEVVTGFRFSYGGAQEYYNVIPDLCTLGKAVAGGFPLTAVAGSREIMEHFDASAVEGAAFLPQIGTLSGNPVASVAGLATLELLRKPGTYERLFNTGQRLKDALTKIFSEAEIPVAVIGEAPLFDVFFTSSPINDHRSTLLSDKQMLRRFNNLLLDQGIFKGESKYYISTAHDQEDLDTTVAAFSSAVEKLNM